MNLFSKRISFFFLFSNDTDYLLHCHEGFYFSLYLGCVPPGENGASIFASLSFALVWRALFVSRVQVILTYGTASYVWREQTPSFLPAGFRFCSFKCLLMGRVSPVRMHWQSSEQTTSRELYFQGSLFLNRTHT